MSKKAFTRCDKPIVAEEGYYWIAEAHSRSRIEYYKVGDVVDMHVSYWSGPIEEPRETEE